MNTHGRGSLNCIYQNYLSLDKMLLILQATPTCLPASAPPPRSWPALLGPGPGLESKENQATPLPYSGREEGVAELEAGACICDPPLFLRG